MILFPRIVLIERYAIEDLANVCKKLQLEGNAVIIADEVTKKIAGDYAKDVLDEEGFGATVEVIDNIDKSNLDKFVKSLDACFIVATGGGKVIDVGKYYSFKKGIPFISVPTTPSHDGIVSNQVSLISKGSKTSERVEPPLAVIADTELMKSCPDKNVSAGCADVISNITAVADWRQTKSYMPLVGNMSLLAADMVIDNTKDIVKKKDSGLQALIWSEILSGFSMSIAGDSSPASGADHNFSHALDSLNAGALHGEQCGLGSIIASYLQQGNWVRIKSVLKEAKAPINAEEINIPEDVLVKALVKAKTVRERSTILDKYYLNEEKAEKVLKTVGII